jgi:hypothetical protein
LQIFKYAGITGESVALLSSGAYGVVKLFFTMSSALFLVDRFGRRPLILMGLLLQLASHIYLGVYMGRSFSGKSPSDGAIAMVYVYALGWSVGLTVVQSIYGTEIFPTRVRSVAYSFVMGVHWFSQFAVVQVTPLMFVSLHVWGAYLFWALICATGLLLLGIWTPETKGVPIEKMDELFEGRWWMGWRAKISQSLDISEDDYTEKSRRVILAEIS